MGKVTVDNPSKMPNAGEIEEIQEPWVKLGIVTPSTYIGTLMELVHEPPRNLPDRWNTSTRSGS